MSNNISRDHSYYIISDLHLAEGDQGNGQVLGTENFFSDIQFSSFIDYIIHQEVQNDRNATLIINGDFVDFIRITKWPESSNDRQIWADQLEEINAPGDTHESFADSERRFGLRTNDYKCIYKLFLSMSGHPELFAALARWLGQGNNLIIAVGNHDPEWYWHNVQHYLRHRLFELSQCTPDLRGDFYSRITFEIEAFTICDGSVYIEHGHDREKSTQINGRYVDPDNPNPQTHIQELYLPTGSFFNRYLINNVERHFPHIDNLTAQKGIFMTLLQEDILLTFSLLGHWLRYALKLTLKRFAHTIIESLVYIFTLVIPLIIFFKLVLTDDFSNILTLLSVPEGIQRWYDANSIVLNPLRNLLLPYLFRLISAWIISLISKKKNLSDHAFELLEREANVHTVIMGHNHLAQHLQNEHGHYINTGSWTSKYVMKYKQIQTGPIHTYVQMDFRNGNINRRLLRWDHYNGGSSIHTSFSNL